MESLADKWRPVPYNHIATEEWMRDPIKPKSAMQYIENIWTLSWMKVFVSEEAKQDDVQVIKLK